MLQFEFKAGSLCNVCVNYGLISFKYGDKVFESIKLLSINKNTLVYSM